jgi:hypothetical protein
MVGYIDILCWTVVCVLGIKFTFAMVDILLKRRKRNDH